MQADDFEFETLPTADRPRAEIDRAVSPASSFAPGSISSALIRYADSRFTGKLTVTASSGERWFLYLHLGNLVWATGGWHPVRRWRRHVQRHCPQVNLNRLVLRRADLPESWDYHLVWLLALRQIAPAAQVFAILQASIAEVLFDIVRAVAVAEAANDREVPATQFCIAAEAGIRPSEIGMLPQQAMVEILPALERVRLAWQQWVASGLTRCAPDLVPTIGDRQALQDSVSPKIFRNLTHLIDGRRSLRDIAAIANRDVLAIARSLVPYLRGQLVTLVKCGDLPRPLAKPPAPQRTPEVNLPSLAERPLIACIDDDSQVTSLLEGIAAQIGCRFLEINDPVQALPLLLQHKPDLIVLDLVMPVANGYEICTQIRRIEQFRNTPIAILTGNDGLVDRMRAKMVGASDFLSKPIDADKIVELVKRYDNKSQTAA